MHRSWRYAPPPPSLSPVVPLPPLLSLGCHFVARCRVRNEPVVPPAHRASRTARALRTRRLYASACHPAGASVLASGARVASSPRLSCRFRTLQLVELATRAGIPPGFRCCWSSSRPLQAVFGRCRWLSSPPGRACRRDFAAAGRARDHCRPFSDAEMVELATRAGCAAGISRAGRFRALPLVERALCAGRFRTLLLVALATYAGRFRTLLLVDELATTAGRFRTLRMVELATWAGPLRRDLACRPFSDAAAGCARNICRPFSDAAAGRARDHCRPFSDAADG
jgi:hypothetical protein